MGPPGTEGRIEGRGDMAEQTSGSAEKLTFGAGLWMFGQFVDRYATDAYGPPVGTLAAIERAGRVGELSVVDINYPFDPGVTTGQVDAAARKVIDAAGYGEMFFHRVGHGLGLEGHEDPSLDPGSSTVLEPGMVFTIEPGVYIPGLGGVRIEDDVVVEESGCRVLTGADRSLKVV